VVRRINSEEKAEPEEVIDVEGTPFWLCSMSI
jgi:hypothetical protein